MSLVKFRFDSNLNVSIGKHASGDTAGITWEDAGGRWHEDVAEGSDRHETDVEG